MTTVQVKIRRIVLGLEEGQDLLLLDRINPYTEHTGKLCSY
jgi:hypothetical protein